MAVTALKAPEKSIRDQVSPEEWEARVDLAAFYRLVALHDMTDLNATHVSVRVPGTHDQFLLNPYGPMFSKITASSLVKVDVEGNVILGDYAINAAGFCIHSAVHMARHDVDCVAHTHTRAGMAISALPQGIEFFTQKSMRFYGSMAYHDFEGIALDLDERERLIRDLGNAKGLILRNHGLLVAGRSVRQAWQLLYNLEKICKVQLAVAATGSPVIQPTVEACEHAAGQFAAGEMIDGKGYRQDGWESQLRLLDRVDSSFRN
jgi:ribulose-5-phosphate 4-epimerase/fuculose-1-phosphate aldolase